MPTSRPALFSYPFSHRISEALVCCRNRLHGASAKLARAHHALHFDGEIVGAAAARVKAEGLLLGHGAIYPAGVGNP